MAASVALLGVPIDCSGTRRGDERGVAALRDAGLAELAGVRDDGDVAAHVPSPERDPATGVIAFDDLRRITHAVRERVRPIVARGELPLLAGGDDSYLPGALAGARDELGRLGLWFADGHLDACDGATSPTGEAADMDLAIALGGGPPALADDLSRPSHRPPPEPSGRFPTYCVRNRPLVAAGREGAPREDRAGVVAPEDAVALGSRLEEPWCRMADGTLGREADLLDPRVRVLRAAEIRAAGAGAVGVEVGGSIAAGAPAWLHLDLDVLDESVMPAVSYPQPDGLSWEELHELTLPLAGSRRLAGIDVACLVPDRDPDGALARRAVELVAALLHRHAEVRGA